MMKIYQKVDANNEKTSFSISRMEDIYEKRNGKSDDPHRHNFYTVLVVKSAEGKHKIDFRSYDLDVHQVFFVSPGQVHQIVEKKASIGYVMTFSNQFLIESSIPISFIESLNLFQDYGHSPPLNPDEKQFAKLNLLTNEIFELYSSSAHMKELSIGAYLKLFLIECNNVCSINPIESNSDISENRIIQEFKRLVNLEYKSKHSTSHYAGLLAVTPDHLNRVIKSTIGKTAKEYIQSRIITEAKRLLFFTDMSNKEIGYELGFNEPANFSAFFKKCTGYSPSNFQQRESSS